MTGDGVERATAATAAADPAAAAARAALPATAAIIGLGLIGGSLARDLARRGVHVLGTDLDEATVAAAVAAGVVHTPLPADCAGVEDADVVILAVPVHEALDLLRRLAPRLRHTALITDVGSTKRSIGEAAEELGLARCFIGSHPLAGDHRSGWAATREGLFRGAVVYLCPAAGAGPSAGPRAGTRAGPRAGTRAGAAALAEALWRAVGATPTRLDAGAHDRLLAWTSHLPQLASSALALTLADARCRRSQLGPGGRDVTRLAGSQSALWAGIAVDNAAELASALDAMTAQLQAFRAAVTAGDAGAVEALLSSARSWSER